MPEMPHAPHDVVILGGGLAGLTLALQLKQTMPDLDVRVIERRVGPAPEAAHKIGESSVEIGAHYFAHTLGLQAHLDEAHVRKFGFRFFWSDGTRDLSAVTELGASRHLTTPSWQIDRGVFENFLGDEALRRGITLDSGLTVRRIDIDKANGHRIEVARTVDRTDPADDAAPAPVSETLHTRWLVDAAGRAGLLKRKLGLAEPNAHRINAVWFRVDTRLVIDDWASDPVWSARCDPAARWRSTNHLCGTGYWLWLIPLGSGAHSVGIVADSALHPLATMDTFERAMDWMAEHQPLVADVLHAALMRNPEALLDYAFFRDVSYGCKELWSSDRWALTGDAGLFLDPFYSPGSDFIAIGNTYITDLIRLDRAGATRHLPARFYGEVYKSLYESTLTLYTGQYRLFGNPRVMPLKVLWDYTYYWGVLCQLCFQNRLTDRALFADLREPLLRARSLNVDMQALLRRWDAHTAPDSAQHNRPRLLDQAALPWFAELNRRLGDVLDDAGVRRRLHENVAQLEQLAAEIAGLAVRDAPTLASALPPAVEASASEAMLFPLAA